MSLNAGAVVTTLRLDLTDFNQAISTIGTASARAGSQAAAGLQAADRATAALTAALAGVATAQGNVGVSTGNTTRVIDTSTTSTQDNTRSTQDNTRTQEDNNRQRQNQQTSLAGLARTLDQSTGAVTANTRAFLANQIGPEQLRGIERLGVSTQDYIDAAAGVPGAADRVRASLAAGGSSADDQARALANLTQQQQNVAAASQNVVTTNRAIGTTANTAAAGTNNQAQATQNLGTQATRSTDLLKKVAAAAGGLAVADYLRDSVNASSDLNETVSKTENIFKDASGQVLAFGDVAAKSVGLSKAEALGAAANFGNMFTQIGFTNDAAAKLSTSTVTLAADLGSFNNLPTADVAEKITGALRGEYDGLSALVPGLSAARVETEALAATGKTNADALTDQEKVTATLAIITKDSANAVGDFARTSDGFANKTKSLTASMEDQKAALGDRLMPVVQTLLDLFESTGLPVIGALSDAFGAVVEFISPLVGFLGDALTTFTGLSAPIQTAAIALGLVALARGPLNNLWTSITTGAATARAGFAGAAGGATGMAAASNVAGAAATRAGLAMKAAFLSNPISLALVAITTAVSLFAGGTEEAEKTTTDFSGAIDELSGKVDALKLADMIDPNTLARMQTLGVSVADYTNALAGNADAQGRVRDALRENMDGQDELSAKYILSKGALDEFEAGLVGVSTAERNAALSTEAKASVQDDAKASTEDLTKATNDEEDAAREQSKAVKDQADAHKDLVTAVENAITALDNLQHRNDPKPVIDANAAIRDYATTIRDQAGAARDAADAQDGFAEANAKLDELTKSGTATQTELAAAQRDVQAAADDVRAAMDGVSDATDKTVLSGEEVRAKFVEQATEAATLAGETGSVADAYGAARGKVDEMITSLRNQLTQQGLTSDEVDAYIDTLGLVPGDVATTVTASIYDKGLNEFKTKVDQLDGKQITVYLDSRNSNAATLAMGLAGVVHNGGPVPGYAAGGAPSGTGMIPGTPPMNPNVDNVLAFNGNGAPIRLRSREWIIQQRVADDLGTGIMAGFNAGRYNNLLKGVRGYAAGGPLAGYSPGPGVAYTGTAAGVSDAVLDRFAAALGGGAATTVNKVADTANFYAIDGDPRPAIDAALNRMRMANL